jgi:hypothetical protein
MHLREEVTLWDNDFVPPCCWLEWLQAPVLRSFVSTPLKSL